MNALGGTHGFDLGGPPATVNIANAFTARHLPADPFPFVLTHHMGVPWLSYKRLELDATFTLTTCNRSPTQCVSSPETFGKSWSRCQKGRWRMGKRDSPEVRDLAARVERLEGWFVMALLCLVGILGGGLVAVVLR